MRGQHRKERGESRAIYAAIVHDLDFMPLSPAAKLLWYTLRLELGMSGIGVLYTQTLPEVTSLSVFDVDAGLQELCVTQWVVRERNVMWLRNALRFDPYISIASRAHVQSVVNHLASLPRLKIVEDFARYYGIDMAWLDLGVPDNYKQPPPDKLFHWAKSDPPATPTVRVGVPPPLGSGEMAAPPPLQELGVRSKELGVRREEKETPAAPAAPLDPPASKSKSKKPRRVIEYSPEFEDIWTIHPKGSKEKAFDEFKSAVPESVTLERLTVCLGLYVTTQINERFSGHDLFRWLRDERWREYEDRRVFATDRNDASARLRTKAQETTEYLRNLGVA